MHRMPRIAPALIGLAALVALFAATSATGRSETAPTNSAEPTITYPHPIKIGTILTGNKGTWNGTDTARATPTSGFAATTPASTVRRRRMRRARPTRSSRRMRTTRSVST